MFSTTQQSIWGPGNAYVSDINVPLFNLPWNTSFGPVGGVSNVGYGFGTWGAELSAGTWGEIGARFYMEGITAGYVDVDYPIQADITYPAPNTIDRGTWVNINTDYNVDNGWALNSNPPSMGEIGLEMTTNVNAYINPLICVYTCVNPAININVNETFPIFKLNDQEAIYPGATGSYNLDCPPPGFGYCTNPTPCVGYCFPAWMQETTFPVQMPDNGLGISGELDLPTTETDDFIYGKCLGAFGTKNYITVGVDLFKFMGNFIPPPVGTIMSNLSNSYDIGPVNFTYNIFSATLQVSIHNNHRFDFCPNVEGTFNFPIPLNYTEVDQFGATIETGFAQSATVDLGNDLNVEYPCNYEFTDISMDYNIKNEDNFTSHIYDSLALDFIIEALQFDLTMPSFQLFPGIYIPKICISVPYPCPTWSKPWKWCSKQVCTPAYWLIPPINIPGFSFGTGGPLISMPFSLANFKYDWYNGTYPLGGFNEAAGGTFTLDAMEYTASAVGLDVDCKGEATGEMTATVVNGVAPFEFFWPDGNVTVSAGQSSTYSSLLAGHNYVTVEDANDCQVVTDYFVTEPAQELNIYNSVITNIDCFGNNNGSVTMNVTGGTAPYSYAWTISGSVTNVASNLAAGNYTVTVTDSKGCTTDGTYTITEPTAIGSSILVDNHVSCFAGSDGQATVTATGGSYPYSFNWSTGGLGSVENGLFNGTHSVLVTDSQGCTSTSNVNITQPAASLVLSGVQTAVTCKNGTDGAIDLTVTGGTAPYSFKWFNESLVQLSATTEDISNISAQIYSVEVIDANGCQEQLSILVQEPANELLAELTSQTNVSCFGGNDGTIDATVSGGTVPYIYVWDNGASTEDINSLNAGTYVLDVTDGNACTAQLSVIITEPTDALASSLTQVDVLCNSDASGSIDLIVSGGTGPYSYLWNNGATTEDLNGIVAANYDVVVTDSKGCVRNDGTVITEPTALTNVTASTAVLCYDGNDGAVSITVNGGVTPYSYSWSNGIGNQLSATIDNMSNLNADFYSVVVTDSNNCQFVETIAVSQPQAPIALSSQITDVLCKGDLSGAVNLSVSGGTPGYIYQWSNGWAGQDLTNVAAGSYKVIVTDNNLCQDSLSVEIDQPISNIEITVAKKDVLCRGDNSGWAFATVTGGVSPYLVNWSNGDLENMTDSLVAGTYTVQAIDANGCIANSGTVINEPLTNVTFSFTSLDASCHGAGDGSITVTPMAGTSPYTVIFGDTAVNLFTNNLNSYTIENLGIGTYPVQVEDGNGCRFLDSVSVSEPDTLTVIGEIYDALCYESSDGAINIDVNGGTTPYTTIWSNATTNEDLVGVPAGWYTVNIIDFNGCSVQNSWEVMQPDDIDITSTITEPTCRDNEDGSITIFTDGGTPDYNYLWSNSSVTESIFNLAPGQYVLIVTDEHGCEKYDTLNINVTDIDCINAPNAFTPDADGYNDTWILDNMDNYPEAIVSIFNTWGNIVFQSNGTYTPWDGTYNGKKLPAATYYYVINLNNGTAPYSGAVTIVILE